MAEVRVAGGRGPKKLFFSFDAAKGDFPLDFERLQAKALAPVDAACWDFLEIAATVFAADTSDQARLTEPPSPWRWVAAQFRLLGPRRSPRHLVQPRHAGGSCRCGVVPDRR